MQMPVISRPHEPALFARAPGLERHRVAPGGLTVIALEPGDRLEVIDLEGDQRAELLAFDETGREALAALGLLSSPGANFISGNTIRIDGAASQGTRAWTLGKAKNSESYNGFHRAYLPDVLKDQE